MKTNRLILPVIALLLAVLPAVAQPTNADFQQAVAEYQQSHSIAAAEKVILLAAQMDPPPTVPVEARKHMSRGGAAAEGAQTRDDFKDAAIEFQLALDAAPWIPNAYRNLAITQDKAGDYQAALESLRLYALTKPSPVDQGWADDLKNDLKNKIEYQQEKAVKEARLAAEKAEEPNRAKRMMSFFCRHWESQGPMLQNDVRAFDGDFRANIEKSSESSVVVILTRVLSASDSTPYRFEGSLTNSEIRTRFVSPRIQPGDGGSMVLQKAGGQLRATIQFVSSGITYQYSNLLD